MASANPQQGPMGGKSMTPVAFAVVVVVGVLVITILSLGVLPAVPIGGTLAGSGHMATKQESFSGFTAVTISNGFQFTITQSASYEVTVTIDDNLLGYVQVSQSGNTLSIGLAFGQSYESPHPSVAISMPDLTQLSVSQGSNGMVTGFNLSHGLAITASQGCTVSVTGGATDLTAGASTGSHLDLSGLHATSANVNLSGGSAATVRVDGRLDATLSDGSHLTYLGNTTLGNINSTGGSTFTKG